MRKYYDKELNRLKIRLTEMGEMCCFAINCAVSALIEDSHTESYASAAARRVEEIDSAEREIEAMCLKILLQQQPVAGDLRRVSAALKMVSDMERIGDMAGDITEITEEIKSHNESQRIHIKFMTAAAVKMVTESVKAFAEKDLKLAGYVISYDDVLDDLFRLLKKEVTELISMDKSSAGVGIDYLLIAKHLERIGDHAANIAEWVVFSITGRHPGTVH